MLIWYKSELANFFSNYEKRSISHLVRNEKRHHCHQENFFLCAIPGSNGQLKNLVSSGLLSDQVLSSKHTRSRNLSNKPWSCIWSFSATLSYSKCKTKQQEKMNRERWFDSDCKTIKKILRNVSKQKHRNPVCQGLCLKNRDTPKLYKNTTRAK